MQVLSPWLCIHIIDIHSPGTFHRVSFSDHLQYFLVAFFAFFSMFCFVLVDAVSYAVEGLPVLGMQLAGSVGPSLFAVGAVPNCLCTFATALCNFRKKLLQHFTISFVKPKSRDNETLQQRQVRGSVLVLTSGMFLFVLFRLLFVSFRYATLYGTFGTAFHLHDMHTQPPSTGLEFSSSTEELQNLHRNTLDSMDTFCLSSCKNLH